MYMKSTFKIEKRAEKSNLDNFFVTLYVFVISCKMVCVTTHYTSISRYVEDTYCHRVLTIAEKV